LAGNEAATAYKAEHPMSVGAATSLVPTPQPKTTSPDRALSRFVGFSPVGSSLASGHRRQRPYEFLSDHFAIEVSIRRQQRDMAWEEEDKQTDAEMESEGYLQGEAQASSPSRQSQRNATNGGDASGHNSSMVI